MPRGKRSPGQISVTLSLPRDFVEYLDALAAEQERSRSNFILRTLRAAVERDHAARGATRQIITSHVSNNIEGSGSIHSLNEDDVTKGPHPKSTKPGIARIIGKKTNP